MALATRCPHCQAVFRVVVDQLKLRGGLVRCGDCTQVFDAIGTLIYVDDAALPAAATPPQPPEVTLENAPAAPASEAREQPAPGLPPDLNTRVLFDEPGDKAEVAAPAAEQAPVTDNVDPEAAPPFLQEAVGPPRRRLSLALLAGVVLAAALVVMQIVVQFRTDLMARWPGMRPLLSALCVPFQCSVGWPTRADLLAVVGSELLAIPGTAALEMTAVVRNRGNIRVALPAIEITLTDTQNRIVARRVFAPADYLASAGESAAAIETGIAPGADHTVKLVFEAQGIKASGFVVYPFYL
jgi:predicted Zn finger-like uncharacterized protein